MFVSGRKDVCEQRHVGGDVKIGLIDVDGHGMPNLALMHISAWHKARGDEVEWWAGHLIYYDVVYMSKIFSDAYSREKEQPYNCGRVIRGGTGYAIRTVDGKEIFDESLHHNLPEEIERTFPDYSIYPQYNFAVSMTSRGCPNMCSFCIVSKKEGCVTRKTGDVKDFWCGQPEIKVLDSNITACPEKKDLMQQYRDTGVLIDYKSGLDIRRLDDEDIEILNETKTSQLHFAWDNPNQDLRQRFERFASLAKRKRNGAWATVYVLTGYNSTLEQDLYRITTLRDLGFDPFVMVYNKPGAPQYTRDLQRWCNNRVIFKSCKDFSNYSKRYKSEEKNT